MKNLILILILFLIFESCKEIPKKQFTIEMEKESGSWTTKTYSLPEDAQFYIGSINGTYYLAYTSSGVGGTIQKGIIDYKIVKSK